ncbi:MAG: hypothetical protein V1487_02350 [bacterium]
MNRVDVKTRWNADEEALDLTMSAEAFEESGMYDLLHGDGTMLMAILGCGGCGERVEAVERMPVSQVERPWFVGRMTADPALIRLKCKYLQWIMLRSGGKGKLPPCIRLRELIRVNSVPGLEDNI